MRPSEWLTNRHAQTDRVEGMMRHHQQLCHERLDQIRAEIERADWCREARLYPGVNRMDVWTDTGVFTLTVQLRLDGVHPDLKD